MVTTSAPILTPEVVGPGAAGGLLSPTDDTFFLLSITFHCREKGSTLVTVSIPALDVATKEPLKRDSYVEFSIVKECLTTSSSSSGDSTGEFAPDPSVTSGLGGVGILGFSIGTKPRTHDIVKDGFPTLAYFDQRRQDEAVWKGAIIDEKVASTSVFLTYDLPGIPLAKSDDLIIPLAVKFKVGSMCFEFVTDIVRC